MRDLGSVSLPVLQKNMQVSTRKFTFVILWSLYELCSEVHNIYVEFRIKEIRFGSDNGFDLHPWWHIIIQEREGVAEKASSLSLISSYVRRSGS